MARDGLAGLGPGLSHLHPWHPSCTIVYWLGLGPLLPTQSLCRLATEIVDMKLSSLLLLCTAAHLAAVHGATRAHKSLVTPLSVDAAQVHNTYLFPVSSLRCCFWCLTCSHLQANPAQAFKTFAQVYSRKYSSEAEHQERFAIFQRNVDYISVHNSRSTSYTVSAIRDPCLEALSFQTGKAML